MNAASVSFAIALALMILGLLMVVLSMPFLGKRSFGEDAASLCSTGIYRYSRNPQLVGGFFFVLGYALLWPSWMGVLWAGLWPIIMHLMVRGEEEHLGMIFGDQYRRYCELTPRYLGLPKR